MTSPALAHDESDAIACPIAASVWRHLLPWTLHDSTPGRADLEGRIAPHLPRILTSRAHRGAARSMLLALDLARYTLRGSLPASPMWRGTAAADDSAARHAPRAVLAWLVAQQVDVLAVPRLARDLRWRLGMWDAERRNVPYASALWDAQWMLQHLASYFDATICGQRHARRSADACAAAFGASVAFLATSPGMGTRARTWRHAEAVVRLCAGERVPIEASLHAPAEEG